jgi:hypothetical protein
MFVVSGKYYVEVRYVAISVLCVLGRIVTCQ